jgi:AAHS family benzoate transporter-like MFS transporter
LIGSCALVGAVVGALIFGFLADRFGRKVCIIGCFALFSAATGLTGMTNGPVTFGVCRFFAGLGIGGVFPNIPALVSEYAPVRNRSLMIASIFSGMQIGGMSAAGLSIWLFPLFGWRSVFYVGAIPLIIVPALVKYLPESPSRLVPSNRFEAMRAILKKARPDASLPENATFAVGKAPEKSSVIDLFREKRALSTLLIWLTFFMNMYMIFGLGIWLPKLMMDAGFKLMSGLWFLLMLQLAAFFGTQVAGYLADRLGARPVLVVGFLMAFGSIALLSQTGDFYLLSALAAAAGCGYNASQNVVNAYAAVFYPPAMRSTALGMAFGVGRLGAIFGPAIAGILVYWKVSLFVNFMGLAVPGLIAAIAVVLIQQKYSFSGRH